MLRSRILVGLLTLLAPLSLWAQDSQPVAPPPLVSPTSHPAEITRNDLLSARNIRALIVACRVYAVDHGGAWPDKLEHALDSGIVKAEDNYLTDPADPKNRPYLYHAWTADERKKLNAVITPVIWSPISTPDTLISVGYLDGHVDRITTADLDKLIEKARDAIRQ